MEILAKNERVFEPVESCLGCGSTLGLKFILQSVESLKNTVLVVSEGEAAGLMNSNLRVNAVKSANPVATASGIADAMPGATVVVYAGDGATSLTMPTVLSSSSNVIYICCNNYVQQSGFREFAPVVRNASYAAAASVSYYEDFVAKFGKASSRSGFRFIDLLAPCPARWGFEPSNVVEIGRMATESYLWPLYDVEKGVVSLTKTPPRNEPVKHLFDILKMRLADDRERELQDYANRKWKALNDGKLI